MHRELETDYLIVGAGAAGMAIADALLTHTDATIAVVDRRQAPGGHWQDAYPFVRLHQPSTFYGVCSVPLGEGAVDEVGTNAGFYELAGADELRAYYERVMHRHFLPTGRLKYFPSCEYTGEHRFVSRLTDASWQVKVRRKLIDTTYTEGEIPATHPPPFAVDEGVRCVSAGEIARLADPPERFVVIGGGKTALDVCVWLLERGVPASAIRWVRPREAWWINRKFQQPHEQVKALYRSAALQLEHMAQAASVDELFERLEEEEVFLRIDREVWPTMFRGAVVSEAELRLLRQIDDVVRMGHVQRIEPDAIILDDGRVPTDGGTVHVHCASRALSKHALRPIFEPGRMTPQPIFWGFACYQFATLGVVEAVIADDEEKNRLCRPISYWDKNEDFLAAFLATMIGDRARSAHGDLSAWIKSTRLNPVSGLAPYRDDPEVIESRGRIKQHGAAAAANLQKLLSGAGRVSS